MADPALNLQVTADITALTSSMQVAQQSVQQSAERMSSSLRSISDIDYGAQAEDLRMQLAILKEMDPVIRAQLEGRQRFVQLSRELKQVEAAGGDPGAREIVRLKQAIAAEQTRQGVMKARADIVAYLDAKESAAEARRGTAIQRLIASNQQLVNSIAKTSDSMAQRFDQSFSNINRGFGRVSRGAQVGLAAASAAAGDLDGTLNALPGTLGAVASTGKVLYDVLHEMFTQSKAAADELAKSIETGQRIMDFRQQAKDLGLQLQAMKELDPIEARRIETQRQLNQVRAEFNRLNTEGAAPQALEALKTREQIILLQEENDVRKIRNELNRKGLEAAKTQSDQQDEDAKLAADAEEARIAKRRELFDLRTKMAMAEEPENRRRLALEQQLLEIDQRRDDAIRKRSDYLADEIAQAEKNLAISEAVGQMETELAEKRLDLMNEEEAARQRMQGVTTVEASFGGALRVANDAAARGQLVATEKQTQIQEEIRTLLRDIAAAQRFAGIQ